MTRCDALLSEDELWPPLLQQLAIEYAELGDGKLADALAASDDLLKAVEALVRSGMADAARVSRIETRISKLGKMMESLERRQANKLRHACWLMDTFGIGFIEGPEYCVALAHGKARLEVFDEVAVPREYFVAAPAVLDLAALQEGLERGVRIAGARLEWEQPYLQVLIR